SDDGRFLAYYGGTAFAYPHLEDQVLVYDRCVSDGTPVAGCTAGKEIASVNDSAAASDGPLEFPEMTPDGRFVIFDSLDDFLAPTNLVPGVTGTQEVYVRDRCVTTSGPVPSCTPSLRRVSVNDDGSEFGCPQSILASISDDGRYVAFEGCSD